VAQPQRFGDQHIGVHPVYKTGNDRNKGKNVEVKVGSTVIAEIKSNHQRIQESDTSRDKVEENGIDNPFSIRFGFKHSFSAATTEMPFPYLGGILSRAFLPACYERVKIIFFTTA
jgi:hypothetical protein